MGRGKGELPVYVEDVDVVCSQLLQAVAHADHHALRTWASVVALERNRVLFMATDRTG